MILILDSPATSEQIEQLQEVYPDYIKVVADIEKNIIAAGGEYHIACEEVLIRSGSKHENLFGGGYDIKEKKVEFAALTNYKPALGYVTYEISDVKIREKLEELTRKFLES